jgi:hypothetical protein
MAKNRIDVNYVSDSSSLFIRLLHKSNRFASDEAETDDVGFHCSVQFRCILGVQEQTFGDDASVVDEQIHATAHLLDPLESGRDCVLIANVALDAVELTLDAKECSSDGLRMGGVG